MCPGAQKVGCRLPSPQGTPKTSSGAIPSAAPTQGSAPSFSFFGVPLKICSQGSPGPPPPRRPPPPASSYLLGGASGDPREAPGFWGAPGRAGRSCERQRRKIHGTNFAGRRSGGASAQRGGAGGEGPPRASPGSRRPARRWVPVCPGPPPGCAAPPHPSAPRSGAGPAHSEFPVTFPGMGSREWGQEAELIPRPAHAFPSTRAPLTKRGEPGVAGPPERWRPGLAGDFRERTGREGLGEGRD